MRRILLAAGAVLLIAACVCAADETAAPDKLTATAAGQESAAPAAAAKKKAFVKVGAIEKIEGSKYLMRQTETRYEFFFDENTKAYLRSEGSSSDVHEKNYLVIKGPKNKKIVLANSVYIYASKAEYDESAEKKTEASEGMKMVFSAMLEGSVRQTDPLTIMLADGREYTVSYDDDTYWILTKKTDKNELKAGDRVKIYFDKLYSIRYTNYPSKVIVDRVKAGF
jgi:hypothetical protein